MKNLMAIVCLMLVVFVLIPWNMERYTTNSPLSNQVSAQAPPEADCYSEFLERIHGCLLSDFDCVLECELGVVNPMIPDDACLLACDDNLRQCHDDALNEFFYCWMQHQALRRYAIAIKDCDDGLSACSASISVPITQCTIDHLNCIKAATLQLEDDWVNSPSPPAQAHVDLMDSIVEVIDQIIDALE